MVYSTLRNQIRSKDPRPLPGIYSGAIYDHASRRVVKETCHEMTTSCIRISTLPGPHGPRLLQGRRFFNRPLTCAKPVKHGRRSTGRRESDPPHEHAQILIERRLVAGPLSSTDLPVLESTLEHPAGQSSLRARHTCLLSAVRMRLHQWTACEV